MAENTIRTKILDILKEAQNGLHYHTKQVKALKTILEHESASVKEFFAAFLQPFSNALLVYKREPAVERLIEFAAKFVVAVSPRKETNDEQSSESEEDEEAYEEKMADSFVSLLFLMLMEYSDSREKAVRFRICQLAAKILTLMSNEDPPVQMSSGLLDGLVEVLLQRVHDRVALVRTHAAHGLSYLQDPSDPECPVTKALVWSMENDSSPEVRKCIVMNIAISKTVLVAIIGRTRDVSPAVRQAAFHTLADKCTLRQFKIEQRLRLLEDGLQDQSPVVKDACVGGLLRNWFLSVDNDFIGLLRRLDVESSSEIPERTLMSLFEEVTNEELLQSIEQVMKKDDNEGEGILHLIPQDVLDAELAFFWKTLCKYFKKCADDTPNEAALNNLDRITPTLSQFCQYLQSYFEQYVMASVGDSDCIDDRLSHDFIARQLCDIIPSLDFTDEVGRRQLGNMVYSLITIPVFPADLIYSLLHEQTSIWPQESYRIEKMIDIIADIRYSGAAMSGNESSIANLSYIDLQNDARSLMKCLAVAGELFKSLSPHKLTPTLSTLMDSLILPCIQNENPYIRDMALSALGLACLLDIELARRHILLFIQVCQVDHENIQATALKVVFDLLHVYGLEAFSSEGGAQGEGQQEEGAKEEVETVKLSEEEEGGEDKETPEETDKAPTEDDNVASVEGTTDDRKEVDETTQKFLHILAQFLDGESMLLREVSAEGLSKLLLCARVVSVKLLVRLLLLWYNPASQDEDRLRSVLGTFFPLFAGLDHTCRVNLADCYIPTMQTIAEAPDSSPLCNIDVGNVADFIINLSAPLEKTEDSAHNDLALQVINDLISHGEDYDTISYRLHCRTLSLLTIGRDNTAGAMDILTIAHQLIEATSDRQSLKYLRKLEASLNKIVSAVISTHAVTVASDRGTADSDKENEAPPVVLKETTPLSSPRLQPASPSAVTPVPEKATKRRGRRAGTRTGRRKHLDSDSDFPPPSTAKKSTCKKKPNKKKLGDQTDNNDGDSDDSLVGEHSPFIRSLRSNQNLYIEAQ